MLLILIAAAVACLGVPTCAEDWQTVDRSGTANVRIPFNSDEKVLEIKTDAIPTIGSSEEIYVDLYDSTSYIGNFEIYWRSSGVTYWMGFCNDGFADFPVSLPTEQDKIWTFIKTSTELVVQCNGQVVLEQDLTKCEKPELWSKTITEIQFSRVLDNASDGYKISDEPTTFTSISAQTDVACVVGQGDCYVYCQMVSPDEIDTKAMQLCKAKSDGSVGSCASMSYDNDKAMNSKKMSTGKAVVKSYICQYDDYTSDLITVTVA